MFWEIFKNKWFLIIWISLSIIGGIWGFTKSKIREDKLRNAREVVCFDFRENVHHSVIAIDNLEYKDEYLNALLDTSINTLDIPFSALEHGLKCKILDYSDDSVMVKIIVLKENNTKYRYNYRGYWIWNKFLKYE